MSTALICVCLMSKLNVKGGATYIYIFFEKVDALCQHPWLADDKNFGFAFRWSKKAKITLETISFWRNIFFSISTFSPLLNIMTACC